MSKYEKLAKDIIKNIGGEDNVNSLTHCITRLRFKLKDETKANDEIIKNMDGVVTVMKSGGQYQVVIGNNVIDVYDEINKIYNFNNDSKQEVKESNKKERVLDKFIDVISGIFQPILGIMAACGMIKGFNTLFFYLGWYSDTSGIYLILNAIGDGLFNFLPLFLGYTSAKKFGLKPMLGLAIGAIMCYPSIQNSALSANNAKPMYELFSNTIFSSPVYKDFLGIPFISIDYTGTVIPVIFITYLASKLEKAFNKVIPDLVKFFFVPMLTLLISIVLGFLIIGPVTTFGAKLITEGVIAIRNFSPLLSGFIVGLTWQILVIFGLHWGFIPVYINNIMTKGYDNVMMPFFACTFATSAVVLAIYFKTKDKKLKEMCLPNFISGIFGVTEPAIYGILLPLKKPFIISCISGAIGGAFYGFMNFRKFMMGGMGVFELPAMIGPKGSFNNFYVAIAGIVITMVIAFVATMILFKDKENKKEVKEQKTQKNDNKKIEILSPMNGEVIPMQELSDDAFSSGVIGQGVGIIPQDGKVYSPVNGVVTTLFPTKHAIGITSDSGVEILIHIGIDTVQLQGEGFEAKIKQGDKVKVGQLMMEVDLEKIKSKGFSTETPVLVTNYKDMLDIIETNNDKVTKDDNIMTILL